MSIRQAVTNLSIPKKLMLIIGLFSIVTLLLVTLSYVGMETLSGTRAYVGGEGLWSKAQKEAVLHLGRYAWSHQEKDYQDYATALEIPMGDRQARLELEKPKPDFSAAFAGFLRGGNHPQDIPGMIHVFRRFRHVTYIDKAIGIWRQGDDWIAELQKAGESLHEEITARPVRAPQREALLERIQHINAELTPLENAFSFTLGEGARWTQSLLLTIMLLATGSFLTMTIFIAFLISRHLCSEIDELQTGASRIADGDFDVALTMDSKDEIGDLARTFRRMAAQRRQAEKLKDESYAHVEAANQELEAFSYSVSHDLRAPLRAIDGFSQELLQNCRALLQEPAKEDFYRIRMATKRMAQLIDDLLELSRLSRTKMTRTTVDLSALTHSLAEGLTHSDPDRAVEWIVPPMMLVYGDPHLLRIALENLLQNAWKFTRRQEHPRIELGLTKKEGESRFFVRDNGVGFNMAYAGKLFKPFERLHDSSEFPGTGIGLALVQRIIRRHGGGICVDSEENAGTTFYFTLPTPSNGDNHDQRIND